MNFGNEVNTPQGFRSAQPQVVTNFTYMHGSHTWKFGGTYSPVRSTSLLAFDFPFRATVFNPTQAREAGISVPSTFTTIGDLMQLPLASVFLPVGKATLYPFPVGGRNILWGPQIHAYVGDSRRATQQLTLNWSVGWSYDPIAIQNRDLPRPRSIAQFFDGGKVDAPRVKKPGFRHPSASRGIRRAAVGP